MVDEEESFTGQRPERRRPVATLVTVAIIIAVIAAFGVYLWRGSESPEPAPEPVTEPEPAPAPQPEPEPEPEPEPSPEPAPEPEPEPEPLPALDESDEPALERLSEATAEQKLGQLLANEELIRKAVRALAAARDGQVVHEYRPVVSPAPPLRVDKVGEARTETEQEYRLLESNYRRYDSYVALLTESDPEALAAWYQRFRPLFEAAYDEHGVNEDSFHSLLMDIIDRLLSAPEPPEEIRLERPKVFYEYRDERLESLTDLQKLMIRIGPEHHRAVKEALRELRDELRALPEPDQAD